MTTWHISIVFDAPRGAVVTDDTISSLHEAQPEFNTVSRLPDNRLEFTVDADSTSSAALYAAVYRRAAEASTDVLGCPVEFLRGEVVRFDHWLEQIDPNGEIRNWAERKETTAATNYAVAPGQYLKEWIDEQGLSDHQVADLLEWNLKQLNEIVNGLTPITSDIAGLLERVVGIPAESWLRYEVAYRADTARIAAQENQGRTTSLLAGRIILVSYVAPQKS